MRNKKLIILFSVLVAITLLVVFNSVLFSVQHVNAYCANMEVSEYESKVLSSHGIKRGTSIFSVNKNKVTKRIKSAVPQVRILNIEKKFPNRIWINYVEVREYVKITEGATTYFLNNDMAVMRIEDGLGEDSGAIRLKVNGSVSNPAVGDELVLDTPSGLSVASVVTDIFSGLERLGYYDSVIDLFDEIDLTGNMIVISTCAGMKWKIVTATNIAEKLRLALSVFYEFDENKRQTGTLTIAGAEKVKCTYSET